MNYPFNCQLILKSVNINILNKFIKILLELNLKLKNIQIKNYASLPKKVIKITVLKSPHVNKKSKEQFEIKYLNAIICIKSDFQQLNPLFKFLKLLLPLGVSAKINMRTSYML
jgi:small subunit ribosomal protein S10